MNIPAKFANYHTELVPLPLAPSEGLEQRLFAAAQCGEAHAIANVTPLTSDQLSKELVLAVRLSSRSENDSIVALEHAAFMASAYRVVRMRTSPNDRATSVSVHGAYFQHCLMRIMFAGPELWAQFCSAIPPRIIPTPGDVLGAYRAAAAASALAGPTCRVFLPTIVEDVCSKVDLVVFDRDNTYLLQIRGGPRVRVLEPSEQNNDRLGKLLTKACGEFGKNYGIVASAKYIEMPGTADELRSQIARRAS